MLQNAPTPTSRDAVLERRSTANTLVGFALVCELATYDEPTSLANPIF